MMYSMMGSGFGPGAFGSLGSLAILVGIIFLVVWAIKHLPPDQLKRAGLWCLLGGLALLLLGAVSSFRFGGFGRGCGAGRGAYWNETINDSFDGDYR
jgi:hypothetical protein